MSRIEVSAELNATPEAVWALVSDLRRIPDWVEDTLGMLTVEPEPAQLGTVYRERSRIAGPITQVTTWTIDVFDPPRRQKHDGRVPMMAATSVEFILELSAGGTRFTAVFEYTPGNPLSALADRLFLRRSLRAGFERSLRNLSELVARGEAAAAASGAPAT